MKCCEHNPCPERPKYWLSRFVSHPYRCPQCGQYWAATNHYDGWTSEWRWRPVPSPRLAITPGVSQ